MNALQRPHAVVAFRSFSIRSHPSLAYLQPIDTKTTSISATPSGLTSVQQSCLDSAIRVDQAGEVAANWIYKGQMAMLGRDREAGPVIQKMWDQEKNHLTVMNKLQLQHNVRPTVLWEVAKVAGFGLGAVTALMGKEAAMACTEAVETIIGEHYDDQLQELSTIPSTHPSIPLLREVITELRDDELEHLDTAVAHDAQKTPAHALLSTVISMGCKVAIELCKKY
ncbi:COQ7 protein [Ramaria rubella]|nr:COQ7 protein [Ramaria rubella]